MNYHLTKQELEEIAEARGPVAAMSVEDMASEFTNRERDLLIALKAIRDADPGKPWRMVGIAERAITEMSGGSKAAKDRVRERWEEVHTAALKYATNFTRGHTNLATFEAGADWADMNPSHGMRQGENDD